MRKRLFLFLLRVHNDIDQLSPIIWKMAQSGHNVRVVFIDINGNIDLRENPLLQFLINTPGCTVEYYYAMTESPFRLPNRPLVNPMNPLKIKALRIFNAFMSRCVWTPEWTRNILKKVKPSVLALEQHVLRYPTPEASFVDAAKALGIPVIALPQGPHVYMNMDPQSPGIKRPVEIKKVFYPEHCKYDFNVAQSADELRYWERDGFDMKKITAMGSARFCPEWQQLNLTIRPPYRSSKPTGECLHVLFLMPHWGKHVDQAKTLQTLKCLLKLKGIFLVIKEHTREGAGSLPKDMRVACDVSSHVELIRSYRSVSLAEWIRSGFRMRQIHIVDSVPLVQWADVVIGFGSSIGIEALCQNKLFINPLYLYDRATMYEAFEAGVEVNDEDTLVAFLSSLKRSEIQIPYSRRKLYEEFIFAKRGEHDVLSDYRALLERWADAAYNQKRNKEESALNH